jgi:hypothetical protein
VTRILYWNIEKFGLNKVNDPNAWRLQTGSALTRAVASADRRRYVIDVIRAAAPDIVVVVETVSRPFMLAGGYSVGSGMLGTDALLGYINAAMPGGTWSCVPPLQTGRHEAVSVFYDRNGRFFTGPWMWPGGMVAAVPPPGPVGGPRRYPGVQRAFLRHRRVPVGSLHNPNVREYYLAARASFTYRAGHWNAGAAIAFTPRAPYMVTFHEPGGPRDITIFAIHAPARLNPARSYLRRLSKVAEITDGFGANETRVVIGDFNVELFNAALAQDPAYGHLQALAANPYRLALRPVAAPPPLPARDYRGYYATHIKPRRQAIGWSTRRTANPYPGWDYVGSTRGPWSAAIDNAFTSPAAPVSISVINAIVGTPMNVVAPVPGGAPVGIVPFARQTTNPPPAVPANPAPQITRGQIRTFRAWRNYFRIRNTSDHFALVLDV